LRQSRDLTSNTKHMKRCRPSRVFSHFSRSYCYTYGITMYSVVTWPWLFHFQTRHFRRFGSAAIQYRRRLYTVRSAFLETLHGDFYMSLSCREALHHKTFIRTKIRSNLSCETAAMTKYICRDFSCIYNFVQIFKRLSRMRVCIVV